MMGKKYQIFISSTFWDLSKQRKAAIEVVVDRGHLPVALERFPAKSEGDLKVITKAIDNCQLYIAILGHRYGEVIPGKSISYTEFEYNYAEERGLCILPFLLNEEEIKQRRANLDANNARDIEEVKNIKRLEKFHNRINAFSRLKPLCFFNVFWCIQSSIS